MDYQHITHPRSRTIKIRVEAPNKVIVVTPPRFSIDRIEHFVSKSEPWIKRQLAKINSMPPFGETTTAVKIFGQPYHKQVELKTDHPIGVYIEHNQLTINPVQLTEVSAASELKRFLKSTAEKYIVTRTKQLALTMGLSHGSISLRQQKTRWGSCSSKGNLNFNWRLVHCPTEIIDYVIIHELAHRKHMNHSTQFWQLVAKYDPAYRQHTGWLKRQGLSLS